MSILWIMWGVGFATGGMATYLNCVLFAKAIVKDIVGAIK